MEDYDAEIHVDPPEEPQELTDGHPPSSQGNDQPNAFGHSGHRRKPFSGRDTRYDEQQNATGTRRKFGSSISTPPVRQNLERALKALTKQPGGSFDSFNTLPSGADGTDLVAKLVLHGE